MTSARPPSVHTVPPRPLISNTIPQRPPEGMRPSCAAMSINRFAVMGPPYPSGVRNPGPMRSQTPYGPRPSQPMAFRYRLFSAGPEVSRNYIPTIINIEESSSSSSSPVSSDGEDNDNDTDNGSSSNNYDTKNEPSSSAASLIVQPPKPRVPKSDEKIEIKYDNKGTIGSGKTRTMDPIVILSDDDSDAEVSEVQDLSSRRKAKMRLDGAPCKVRPPSDPMKLTNIFPEPEDDDLKELIQYGMSMIDAENLLKKLSGLPHAEKPRRMNQKGLYSQVKHGNLARSIAFVKAGANPAAPVKSEGGRTPIHIAAAKGHLEVLLILLYKAGASQIDCVDNTGRTPLFFAVEKKHMDVAQLLVKGGANVLVRTSEGMNLLHAAARKGSLVLVKWLVMLGIPINDQDNFGWTALMWAAESDSNQQIMEYLIKLGAITNLLDKELNICLHWAAIAGSFECTKLLVCNSVDPHINAKNKFGETPLHVAAKGNHYHVTQFLLVNGADHTIKNKDNASPLDVCPAASKTFHCIRIKSEVGDGKATTFQHLTDISRGKERVPVSCINEIDEEAFPEDFIYISVPEESNSVTVKRGLSTVRPCKCIGGCRAACKCVKLSEKQKLWYTEDGKLDLAIFEEESPVLYECTPLCMCWSYCPNRVAQKGIQYPLQVFKTRTKGWGLRTLAHIPAGAFILSYVGELITDEEAEKRNEDTYLFNLDLKTCGDEPNCMDALKYGNCGRFINHSCDANMKAVKLFTTHRDISFPGVAFFAYKYIEPKEELCFNYGDSFWDVKNENGMFCKCGSDNCQYSGPV